MQNFLHFNSRWGWRPRSSSSGMLLVALLWLLLSPSHYPRAATTTYKSSLRLWPPSSSFTRVLDVGPPPSSMASSGSLTLLPAPCSTPTFTPHPRLIQAFLARVLNKVSPLPSGHESGIWHLLSCVLTVRDIHAELYLGTTNQLGPPTMCSLRGLCRVWPVGLAPRPSLVQILTLPLWLGLAEAWFGALLDPVPASHLLSSPSHARRLAH